MMHTQFSTDCGEKRAGVARVGRMQGILTLFKKTGHSQCVLKGPGCRGMEA